MNSCQSCAKIDFTDVQNSAVSVQREDAVLLPSPRKLCICLRLFDCQQTHMSKHMSKQKLVDEYRDGIAISNKPFYFSAEPDHDPIHDF